MMPELATGKITNGQLIKQTGSFAYVSQFVDNQMIMETPRDELKFVLDNQGYTTNDIQLRVTEVASFLGIVDLLDQTAEQLSGGQKQLVNLASALILKPEVLLLDEPTAQLDPIAAEKLLQMVHKVNIEFNMTIILVEHELEQVTKFTKRLLVMEDGTLLIDLPIEKGLKTIFQNEHYRNFLPQVDRLSLELQLDVSVPLDNQMLNKAVKLKQQQLKCRSKGQFWWLDKPVLTADKISFRFNFNGRQIVDNVSLQLCQGQSYCIVGPNGMGKTTLLKILTQQLKQQSGKLRYRGKKLDDSLFTNVFILPQNPATIFMKDTVEAEINYQITQSNSNKVISDILDKFSLNGLESQSPYDLSGGQQEFLALALGFIKNPEVLLLDEPTKGLDPNKRMQLGRLLYDFKKCGGTLLVNSHDLLFAASSFDHVAMMFDGKLSDFSDPVSFFSDKFFYTTEINKALRDIFPQALTWKDITNLES